MAELCLLKGGRGIELIVVVVIRFCRITVDDLCCSSLSYSTPAPGNKTKTARIGWKWLGIPFIFGIVYLAALEYIREKQHGETVSWQVNGIRCLLADLEFCCS